VWQDKLRIILNLPTAPAPTNRFDAEIVKVEQHLLGAVFRGHLDSTPQVRPSEHAGSRYGLTKNVPAEPVPKSASETVKPPLSWRSRANYGPGLKVNVPASPVPKSTA
jgi:hypothetical protein